MLTVVRDAWDFATELEVGRVVAAAALVVVELGGQGAGVWRAVLKQRGEAVVDGRGVEEEEDVEVGVEDVAS